MSRPPDKAVESILMRVVETLNEWDNSCYALIVRSKEDRWHYALRGDPEDSSLMAHGLLDMAIKAANEEEETEADDAV